MTIAELKERVADRFGITTLNDMQLAMAHEGPGKRLMLLAPTGSGKTLAFTLPFLASLTDVRPEGDSPRGVIVAPTRELVLQIYDFIRTLSAPELKVSAFYGGHKMEEEKSSLSVTPDIAVATPGRLLDHLRRGHLTLSGVRSLVLDEYDKALELGFRDEMERLTSRMKHIRTLILTSATRAPELPDFLNLTGLKTLDFSVGGTPAPAVTSYTVASPEADKLKALGRLLQQIQGGKTIVFVNHRDAADRVFNYLAKDMRFPAGLYHGGLEQSDRERAIVLFQNGTTPILVATDLAARGLDIDSVESVVHYHLPNDAETNTHRNGRTARQGGSGNAYYIMGPKENIPEYLEESEPYQLTRSEIPVKRSETATIHFNAGKKEKISKGDIAGYLIGKGGLRADEVGRIDVKDHYAYAAVPADKARATVENVAPHKLKNTRVRVTQVKNK